MPKLIILDFDGTLADTREIVGYLMSRFSGKVTLLTEEMHRYHINRWKNFPWFDYMYEGKECGIDLK